MRRVVQKCMSGALIGIAFAEGRLSYLNGDIPVAADATDGAGAYPAFRSG